VIIVAIAHLLAEPADWPRHLHNVGAPVVPPALRAAWGEDALPPGLAEWLGAGDPPVYFGFGSMPVLDPAAAVGMITTVARRLGVRALIGRAGPGWRRAP
jgi:sterol 3beta-glucosyltransferase